MTNCIIKMPKMAATKLSCSNFKAAISGIANNRYLKIMDPMEIENIFLFDLPNLSVIVLPIKIKLSTLKTVPSINPLPTGLWPIRINKSPTVMDRVNAIELYFFGPA